MSTKLKKVFSVRNVIVLLVLVVVVMLACVGMGADKDDKIYTVKDLKRIRDEIKADLSEHYEMKDTIIKVYVDEEVMAVVVEIDIDSADKDKIMKKLTRRYGNVVCFDFVKLHWTLT